MELLKYGGDSVVKVLEKLFNEILRGENIPVEMLKGYLIPIYKKGDRKDCENYRGTCVINTVMKVFGSVTKTSIEKEYRTQEEQSGLADRVSTTYSLLNKYWKKVRLEVKIMAWSSSIWRRPTIVSRVESSGKP
ncbi:uncharacterized protein [Rhodnius prolixus]|uniref:uncharacterized protein n=1 Tax=Rhodnius prolixus TaxID=13249 RepID=UPI003D18BF37